MAKKTIKAECITSHSASGRISLQFAVAPEDQPAAKPGEPAQRVSRTVISINSTDEKQISDLRVYIPGKSYTLTIE